MTLVINCTFIYSSVYFFYASKIHRSVDPSIYGEWICRLMFFIIILGLPGPKQDKELRSAECQPLTEEASSTRPKATRGEEADVYDTAL